MAGNDNTGAESFRRMVGRYLDQAVYVDNLSEESPFFPQHVHIGPTNACNLRCLHCHHHLDESGKSKITRSLGVMSSEIHKKVIDEIAPLRCSVTYDEHGEPTLHKQFMEFLAYTKSKGLYASLLTNATRLDEAMTKRLLELKLDRIVFSFDAVEKDLYEEIRVRAKFEETLRNVLYFIKCNHEQGHPTHVCMSMVVQERTLPHKEEYHRYFEALPVDKIFFSNLLNISGGSGVSDEINLESFQQTDRQDWPICRLPWENLAVTWDGEVSLCTLDYNCYYSVGNVADATLQELWNNERSRQFRRAHLERDYRTIEEKGPLCSKCNCLWDPEYDIRGFRDFAVKAISRNALHYARQFVDSADECSDGEKYKNVLGRLSKLECATAQTCG